MRRPIYIGTSGWNYPHWRGVFYPEGLAQKNWLAYYVNFFNGVELNVTFYRLPQKEIFENWRKNTPKNFRFAAKGSRFITHIKRLKDVKAPLNLFFKNASGLGEKMAAVLWQLPPAFKQDLKRLEPFLKLIKKTKIRQAFEFRNQTWFNEETYALLKEYNACLCIAHSGGRFPCIKETTSDFLYLRFHGVGALYSSNYSDKELKGWAEFAKKHRDKNLFAFFNNDARGFAVKNALRFRELFKR
ncbi:MAG: hypothetical protein COV72_09095 [Candidatus Omnitrophica bacterium CG11_big_fil_rev_8_21_14_0_20_42_13]|uniref:DUF72 domain-containing protein n=1 Tax=Candidatus Ghiorseimicrobium undicola TaxID=1974746 RepID=A0A2H0LV04_9BACT|nr:MAG: hypothetical protein COV72_09095 [Candidatus Omnitrophica bacterium CG11_big_fil_rev_8_21_14_0_20_42_13]